MNISFVLVLRILFTIVCDLVGVLYFICYYIFCFDVLAYGNFYIYLFFFFLLLKAY